MHTHTQMPSASTPGQRAPVNHPCPLPDADVLVPPTLDQLADQTLKAVLRMIGPVPWDQTPAEMVLVTTLPRLAREAGWSTRQALSALVRLHAGGMVLGGSLIPADTYAGRKGTVVVVLRL